MEDYEKKYKELLQEFLVAQDEITGLKEDIENLKSQFIFNEGTCRNLLTRYRKEIEMHRSLYKAMTEYHDSINDLVKIFPSQVNAIRSEHYKWESSWEGEEEFQENNTI